MSAGSGTAAFLTGIGGGDWHAIKAEAMTYALTGPAYSVAFAACGELVRVSGKNGAYDRTTTPVTFHPCQACAWTVAAAGGEAGLLAEAARLCPEGDELRMLERSVPDPMLSWNACRMVIAEAVSEDGRGEVDHPEVIQLLAAIAAHSPVILMREECADGECEHPAGNHPASSAGCAACSLQAADWAGEWAGQFMCVIPAPCAVLTALAAQAEAALAEANRLSLAAMEGDPR